MASRQRANGFDTNFAKCDPHHRLFSERIVWSLFDLKVTRKPAFTEAWLPLASLEVTRCLLFLNSRFVLFAAFCNSRPDVRAAFSRSITIRGCRRWIGFA